MKKFYSPKTPEDFRFIERLVRAEHSDESITNLFKSHEWRTETYKHNNVDHCASCYQAINLNECVTCGQTIYEGEIYE